MNTTRLGGRFLLGELLGHGSFGQVFRALDTALDIDVAVKFVRSDASDPGAFFKEIALLRLLRLPGVVGQVADGITGEGAPYLVTEFVDGSHFPGRTVPAPWSDIEGCVVALLEALDRVHAAGVTHRDLKPANVLVSAKGVPTILDFGLASDTGDRRPEEYLVGTPLYLAPEQALGRRAGPRADIYAVGVMIYEALSGRRPIDGSSGRDVIARKVREEPVPLRTWAPDAPDWLVTLVDRMVAMLPRNRPASAADVLAAMEHPLPTSPTRRLGPPLVGQIADRVAAGERVTIGGTPGSGRSRLVDDVAAELVARGAVVTVVRGDGVCEQTSRDSDGILLLDSPRDPADHPLAKHAAVRLVDGGGATVTLDELTATDLAALFHGPESLLHIPSEAAVELHRRAGGNARGAMSEVGAWVRAGLCHWEDGRVRITRPTVDALRTTYPVMNGGAPPRPRPDGTGGPPGPLGPVRQLVFSGDIDGAARAALQASRDMTAAGLDGEAFSVGLEADRLARATRDPDLRRATLRNVCSTAVLTYNVRSVDIARWEVEASGDDAEEARRLGELMRVWEDVVQGARPDPEMLRPGCLPFFGDEVLDRALCIAFARVPQWEGPLGFERGAAIAAWLAGDTDGERSKHIAGCMARAAFMNLDFEMSAALHEYAATRRSPSDAVASLTSAAYAYLDGYHLDDAERVAAQALAAASAMRAPQDECAATDALARARYRRGEPSLLGAEFREAAGLVSAVSQGVAAVHDAAAAWRLGDSDAARGIAREAARAFARANLGLFVDVMRAFLAALGETIAPARTERIRRTAVDTLPPGLGLQALGLLAMAGLGTPEDAAVAHSLAARLPHRTWRYWREIVSVDECLAAVASAAGPPGTSRELGSAPGL